MKTPDSSIIKRKVKAKYGTQVFEMDIDTTMAWPILERCFTKTFKLELPFSVYYFLDSPNHKVRISTTKNLNLFLKTKLNAYEIEITPTTPDSSTSHPVPPVIKKPTEKKPLRTTTTTTTKTNGPTSSKSYDTLPKQTQLPLLEPPSKFKPIEPTNPPKPKSTTTGRPPNSQPPNPPTTTSHQLVRSTPQSPMDLALNFQLLCDRYTDVFTDFPDLTLTREFLVEQILFGVPIDFTVFERGLQRHSIRSRLAQSKPTQPITTAYPTPSTPITTFPPPPTSSAPPPSQPQPSPATLDTTYHPSTTLMQSFLTGRPSSTTTPPPDTPEYGVPMDD